MWKRALVQSAITVGLIGGATTFLVPATAEACGGLFCNGNTPVVQAEEEILFIHDEHYIDAHVRIQYQGNATNFAWIVPVPNRPTVDISTDSVFDVLAERTAPNVRVDYREDSLCIGGEAEQLEGCAVGGGDEPVVLDDGDPPEWVIDETPDDPTAIEMGRVGPYDYAVLRPDSSDLLADWLTANGFQVPSTAPGIFDAYLAECPDMHFVAFRLTSDATVGDITPIRLRFAAEEIMIPIRLTALAAVPSMGITVYLVGEGRAVPSNYRHVELNQARFDWVGLRQPVYDSVAAEAIDDAGGHAFITEYAAPAALFARAFYDGPPALDPLSEIRDAGAYIAAAEAMGVPLDRQFQEILTEHVTLEGTTVSLLSCPECLTLDGIEIDAAAATEELYERIFAPLREVQEQFDRLPYVTRMRTILSPDEMNLDPTFTFNNRLEDVSNELVAEGFIECINDTVRFTLPNGRLIIADRDAQLQDLTDLPAAQYVEQLRRGAPPLMLEDNTSEIDARLALWNAEYGMPLAVSPGSSLALDSASALGACASTSRRLPSVGVVALALLFFRRRRAAGPTQEA